jgi:vesicle coat complex subunit
MKPIDKADELFNKMDMIIYTDQDHDSQCKRCALIAVDEILDVIEDEREGFNWKEYYLEVKTELEKL